MQRSSDFHLATEFFEHLSAAQRRVLLLDEGTLAGSPVSSRTRAASTIDINHLLERVLHETDTQLVIITSGDARELQSAMKLNGTPEIWGGNGRERILPSGEYSAESVDPVQSRALIIARNVLVRQNLESHIEEVDGGIALRWRGLTQPARDHARRLALRAWKPIAEENRLQLAEREGGLELNASYGTTEAVRQLLGDLKKSGVLAYLGVDERDEDIFRSLLPPHLPVLMRAESRVSAARLCLKGSEDLSEFLHEWLAACGLAREEIDR